MPEWKWLDLNSPNVPDKIKGISKGELKNYI